MDLDNLYRIEIMKSPAKKWSLYFTDRYIAYALEDAQARVIELRQGVEDLKDKTRFPRIEAVNWKFRYRKLTRKEKNSIEDAQNRKDNKLVAQEWDPLDITIKGGKQ